MAKNFVKVSFIKNVQINVVVDFKITVTDFAESPIKAPITEPNYENSVPRESSSTKKCSLNNGVITTGVDPFSFISTSHENVAIGEGDVTVSSHDLAALTPPAFDPPQQSTPLLEKFANSKYDIVILSLFIQLLYSFSITFENTYFFLPLLLYSITKSILYPKQQNSNIANAILLLNGVSASKVQKIMSLTQWISTFSQDVCVFLFTTICTQLLWQTVRDTLV